MFDGVTYLNDLGELNNRENTKREYVGYKILKCKRTAIIDRSFFILYIFINLC